jgi:DNA-binding response OmpR family regulator
VESTYPVQLEIPFDEPVKLLIVEDDPDTREMLAFYFAIEGYRVTTVGTGKQALEAIQLNRDFDVVLLDLFIPDIGGMEVLSEISHQTPRPSVILLTGLADKEIARDALRLGAFDYILKPFNLPQVESSVVASLAHREYLKQSWWNRIA